MRKLLRNPEVKKTLLIFGIVTLVSCGMAMWWQIEYGLFTFAVCVIFMYIHLWSSYKRYSRIKLLSSEIDEILHGDGISISLDEYAEGELGILQSEIHKMTTRLQEQKLRLQEDKIYLADSLTDISHQIRTPLTSINLLASMLADPDISKERRMKLNHELLGLLSRIDWLITTLLKISKLDAGTVQMKKEIISLSDLIHKAAMPVLVPMELRNQNLELEADGEFWGDIAWTSEAIGNVVKNCMEHTQEGGKLRIKALENSLYVEILIEDNGPGISKEDLPYIFERFYKGKQNDKQSFGIGLALARMVIAKQNGVIKAENRAEGGARFTIRFYKGTI